MPGRAESAPAPDPRTEAQTAERRSADADPAYQAAVLRAQLDAVADALLIVSGDRRVVGFNRHFGELFALPDGFLRVGEEVPGLMAECRKLVTDPEEFTRNVRWAAEHPTETIQVTTEMIDGRIVEGYSAPVLGPDGSFHGRVWYLKDETERRTIERDRQALLSAEQEARRDAERARSRLAFLADASDALAASLDRDEVIRTVARCAVPTLATWAVVSIFADGQLHRVAAAHADPAKADLTSQLLDTRPLPADATTPAAEAFRMGHTVVLTNLPSATVPGRGYGEDYLALARQLGGDAALAVPLRTRGRAWGLLALITSGALEAADIELAEEYARRAATAIDNATLYERERTVATALQRAVLPEALPRIPGIELAARYSPAVTSLETGGDWYDAFVLPEGGIALAVGDVGGHGIRAASVMGQLRSALRAYAFDGRDPAEVLHRLDLLLAATIDEVYATAVYATFDPATGVLRWANAGHPPPLLATADSAAYLDFVDHDLLLGSANGGYVEHRTVVERGATVWLYSDGLVEARRVGLEPGMARLSDAARLVAGTDMETACDEILERVLTGRQHEDDVCLLGARRSPDPDGRPGDRPGGGPGGRDRSCG